MKLKNLEKSKKILKIIKKQIMFCFFLIFIFTQGLLVRAADMDSILALVRAPIAGVSLPENIIAQVSAYLLAHPDIDYEALEAKVRGARAVVENSVRGKEINSISDIANSVSSEQKNALIANIQSVANEAKVSVALDQDESGKDEIVIVDKSTGVPAISVDSIIKSTGRSPNVSLRQIKYILFLFISLIEFVFIYKYKKYKKIKYNF
ncbi:MAG: hypothetical protein J6C55_01445 [Oscillospiraceae bacterium]|nr:hypothetical protein [Oscillospiraceae bacterium]